MVTPRIATLLLAVAAGLQAAPAQSPALNDAEVRLPYAELRRLIDAGSRAGSESSARPPVPSALLSARYRLDFEAGGAVLDADFHADHLATDWNLLPLIAGSVSLDRVETAETRLIVQKDARCLALNQPGAMKVSARFLLIDDGSETLGFHTPPCTSPVLEIADLPEGHGLNVEFAGRIYTLTQPATIPLPAAGAGVELRLIDQSEAAEALRPPEPSTWSWQHQAVVSRCDGQLHY